jgi:hypothetical protein
LAAIQSGIERVPDRLGTAALIVRGLMVLAAVNFVVASVYWTVSAVRDLDESDSYGGPMEWTPVVIAILAAPVLVLLAAHAIAVFKGRKLVAGLRSGSDRARRSAFRLAVLSSGGLVVMGAWALWVQDVAEDGDGLSTFSLDGMVGSIGGLNSLGWTGLLSFFLVLLLFVGSVAVALFTRPMRGSQG